MTPAQLTEPVGELDIAHLHASLTDPVLESMNLLNELAERYPDAVSFAAGRPYEGFYDVEDLHRYLRAFHDHLIGERGCTPSEATRLLFQYGRTKGIIHEAVAAYLKNDEGIHVEPESVVVTVGCQEALFLVLRALRADARDVLLAVSPTYIGVTGAARLVDMPLIGVADGPAGLDLADLQAKIDQARSRGLAPRALYLVPDFSNPSGLSLSLSLRHRLLDLAQREGILILEDNPYGTFSLANERPPTLKSLDTRHRVVYLGSFAKTAMPGARIGFAVADQRVRGGGLFADELAKLKSMLTVNTPPLAQAVIGGRLVVSGYSLINVTARDRAVYRENLRRLLAGLARRFPRPGRAGVRWSRPAGGYFVTLIVPFAADDAALARSASEYGVLWVPMHHFYDGDGGLNSLRLSCSYLKPADIEKGLDRVADFIGHSS